MTENRFGHNRTTRQQKAWDGKESTLHKPKRAPTRVDLTPKKFDDLIEEKGVRVKVFRTGYCPAVASIDGAEHDIACTICNGSGWVDLDPLCVKAYIQNQILEKLSQVEGFIDGNQVAMTFPIGVELQYFTLVELEDFTDIYYQRVLRNPTDNTDVLKYHACRVNFVIDRGEVRYHQDQDYKLDLNGNVHWLSTGTANKPANGIPYSIHYETKVQFRALRAIKVNRFSSVLISGKEEHLKFPEYWLLTKEFLVRRVDQDGNELKQGPFDSHIITP